MWTAGLTLKKYPTCTLKFILPIFKWIQEIMNKAIERFLTWKVLTKRKKKAVEHLVADTDREAMRKKFFDECLLLNKLKHPNIVQFLGIHQRKEDIFLVMEYMHMALDICLKEYPDIPLPFKSTLIQDVSYGLLHLHSLNPPIIHRDLTASNVLLTEGMRAKIADLGMSKLFDIQWLQRQSGQTVQPGAPAYMPPEALAQTPSYDLKLDIFSFGALMLYTATQEFPTVYELSVNDFTKDAMKNHTIQILKRKCWIDKMGEDHPFRSLVLQCLQDRPEARPTAKVLCEDISSICCRYKKEWKNILELHSQLQTSSSNNEKLRSSIIELQKSNAELEQVRSEAERVKSQLEKEIQQHVIKEEQLYGKLVNQTLEFRDKKKQLEDELYGWLQASKELKMQPCRKDTCDDSHDTKPASIPRQRASTISDPGAFSAAQKNLSHLNQSDMDRSVENSVPAEEQDSSKLEQQRKSSRDLCDPFQPPSSKDQGGDTSLPNPDSCFKIPLQQPLSLISNNSQPQRKPPGGVAVIPLPLKVTCLDSHEKPASIPRQRASTISDPGAFSAAQKNYSHLNQSELDRSVKNSVPAEEQDSSKLEQQRKSSRYLSHPFQPQSSKEQCGDTSLPNPDSYVKIPLQQPLSLMSNHSQPQKKPPGGVAVIPLPLKNELKDRHDTKPASKPRQRAATLTGHRALSATEPIQTQSIVPQMGQSVKSIIPAEEQDSSKFAQLQLSKDYDDPSRLTSSKGQDASMSGSPQHQYEKRSFSTSRQTSSTFLKYSTLPQRKTPGGEAVNPSPSKLTEKDTFSDNHDIRPVPKPRQRASICLEHGGTQQDRSGMTLPQPIQSQIDPLAGRTMPAEEQDLSKCERKSQFSTNLVDPSVVTSSDSRSGSFLLEHTANISEEPSSVITASQFQSQRQDGLFWYSGL
ncbi:hypothetical protein EMCRGX_G007651 [Ephydatia muelleri]